MKNRRDTGVFLRIYHRSGLKSRLDSYSRSIFFYPVSTPLKLDFLFPDRERFHEDGISLKFRRIQIEV